MTLRNYLTKVRDMAQGEVRQADVERVRASNRRVAERIGAMSDGFLGRARLGLDSGYTSRVLRSLEPEGLTTVTPQLAVFFECCL